jgi:hypothetical protein
MSGLALPLSAFQSKKDDQSGNVNVNVKENNATASGSGSGSGAGSGTGGEVVKSVPEITAVQNMVPTLQ